jgi:hypothetical protein
MVRARYKPVNPDQRIRELRKEFKELQTKVEPGPERAEQLAAFTRAAHGDRQLNMAMHTAALSIEEDPDPPAMLIAAYLPPDVDDPEERLHALMDLKDLGRYIGHDELRDHADDQLHDEALAWVREATDSEQRYRLRQLASYVDQRFADAIRDEVTFG